MAAKVFQMTEEDCFAAESLEDALRAMAELYDYETTPEGISEMRKEYGVDDPQELTEDELHTRKVRINDPDSEEAELITFREHLDQLVADQDLPCLFSSTEY